MAEAKDIPPGTYSLELGSTFTEQRKNDVPAYHTLRYDFKPMSVASSESDTYIAFGGNGDVHVAVPTEGDNMTVFKGSKKEAKGKECLLFFDKKTGRVRLEKITSNINVKKTRDLDRSTESVLRNEMSRLRASRKPQPPPLPDASASFPGGDSSSSSSSSSDDSDSDSGSGSDDGEDKNKKQRRDSNSSMSDMENHLLESMKSSAPSVLAVESDLPNVDVGATSNLQTYHSRLTEAFLFLVRNTGKYVTDPLLAKRIIETSGSISVRVLMMTNRE